MKIIRHTARDMRQALRGVREQLGEDAVILSSRRTDAGVEVTAAVDFDAAVLETSEASLVQKSGATGSGARIDTTLAPRIETPASVSRLEAPSLAGGTETAPPAARTEAAPPALRAFAAATQAVPATSRSGAAAAPSRPASDAPDPRADDFIPLLDRAPPPDSEWISAAAREAVVAHAEGLSAASVAAAPVLAERPAGIGSAPPVLSAAPEQVVHPASLPVAAEPDDPVGEAHAASLEPLAAHPEPAAHVSYQPPPLQSPAPADALGSELKTLRRMLETQLAHLAWNDLTRRAPVRTEMLRELTEIGVTHELAEHLVRQLPEDTDLPFARRFTIAGLSQYLTTTGDRWLDDGGRLAFVGATGVGKTTTLAKIAVKWVLRHGPRDVALVAGDSVRIGALDQLQSLGQMLGVPVYTPERFDTLPTLLSRITERLVLIDTPGSSVRDPQLSSRLAVLANSASQLQSALVLAASTQAGAIEELVKHYAPANPACCVLTKLDEAASLGGLLSVLIRARLPVSYVSEGQRVPEDLRPARALELVSSAVRLAKATGATADEDLLRRRFGKVAHGLV